MKQLLLLLVGFGVGLGLRAEERPNFVVVLVDDLGWSDLGIYGSSFYETPRLDGLAKSAVRFTEAYASCPVCSPTRASLLTGKHPVRVDITDWIPGRPSPNRRLIAPEDEHQLALGEITVAEALRAEGYRTFFAGKWHLGGEGYLPEDQGFEVNVGGFRPGSPPGGYYSPYKNPKLADGPEGEYLPDRLTDEAMAFMEANREAPFLVYLSFYTVHTPVQPCRRHIEKFREKAAGLESSGRESEREGDGVTKLHQDDPAFASMVYAMDENVGRLLDKLAELELEEETVVIVTSDNGGLSTLPPKRRASTSNRPLRAGKGWLYEGGIRVPLMIAGPGVSRPGSLSDVPVVSMDLYPTILAMAGLEAVPDQPVDGVDLSPLLQGEELLDREALFWHYPHYHGSAWTPGSAVRAGEWKLIHFYEGQRTELYHLASDLGERRDLAGAHPGKVEELLGQLRDWQEEQGAQLPRENQDYEGRQ